MVEIINLQLYKPQYEIGQVVYIPEKGKVAETRIKGYEVQAFMQGQSISGVVSNYKLLHMVSLRRGENSDLVHYVKDADLYTDKKSAVKASVFVDVLADEESWKLAIGDRNEKNPSSPYHLDNCEFPTCCANVSEGRDILIYCRSQGGLIVHERDQLQEIINQHDLNYKKEGPLGRILAQLRID